MQTCLDHMDAGIARVAGMLPDVPQQEVRMTRLLLLVGGSLLDVLESNLKPHGLNDSDFRTLMILYSSPEGATPSELCGFAQQGATNMTRIGNVLVKAGLATRVPSAQDRRRIVLSITPAGKRLVRKMLPPLFPKVLGAFASLSASDKRALERLLRQVALNLDSLQPTDSRP
ncbi:MarR family winged helix-turn-helix transcriptional regulator [Dyella sedimenti]|uniref:MarR family winged helix-turn-helix transcriptional regulator n=1 Tax=Dyella sedimenti TaxID=2919947 RepID=UPI0031F2E064